VNYLIDLIILAIISISTIVSYKKGLIKVAFSLVSFILALVISIAIYKPVSNFIINNTSIDDNIEATISTRLYSSDTSNEEIDNFVANYFSNIKNASTAVIADTISKSIINICCMIIVFIISNIALLLFRFIGDLFAKLPLIKQLNSVGGFLYGILKGFIIVYILLAIIAVLSPLVNMNELIVMINKSIIANIMYNNNIIFILFN